MAKPPENDSFDELFSRLSQSSRQALAFAESAREATGDVEVTVSLLLLGLYQKRSGTTRRVFNDAGIHDADLSKQLGFKFKAKDIQAVRLNAMPALSLAVRNIMLMADDHRELRGEDYIRARYLFEQILRADTPTIKRLLRRYNEVLQPFVDGNDESTETQRESTAQTPFAGQTESNQFNLRNDAPDPADSAQSDRSNARTYLDAGGATRVLLRQVGGTAFFIQRAVRPWEYGVHSVGFVFGSDVESPREILSHFTPALHTTEMDELIARMSEDALEQAKSINRKPMIYRLNEKGISSFFTFQPPSRVTLISNLPADQAVADVVEELRVSSIAVVPVGGLDDASAFRPILDSLIASDKLDAVQEVVFALSSKTDVDEVVLRYGDTPQAGTSLFSAGFDVDGHRSGVPKKEQDSLKLEHQVDSFAKLVVTSDVKPPLALGLFGDWGSGKTFFMELLEERINELTEGAEKNKSISSVAQIWFNAWHYVDTNLWASIAVHIFDELAALRTGKKRSEMAADNLVDEYEKEKLAVRSTLESTKQAKREAEAQRTNAATALEDVIQELDKHETERAGQVGEYKQVRFDRLGKRELKASVDTVKKVAGVLGMRGVGKSIDSLERALKQLSELRGSAAGVWAAFIGAFTSGKQLGITAVVIVGAALILFGLVPLVIERLPGEAGSVAKEAGAVLSQLFLGALGVANWAKKRLAQIGAAVDKGQDIIDEVGKLDDTLEQDSVDPAIARENQLRSQITEKNAQIEEANEQISDNKRRIADAEARIREIDNGALLYDYAEERLKDPKYQEQLGLISVVRRDFEMLQALFKRTAQKGELVKIDRIVLYIDDLDRCHPDKVVEVLQAVHLLLAFDLFVVVVGVDARWLERSLYRKYVPELKDIGDIDSYRQRPDAFSPHNYLEKIFQIPFSLSKMNPDGFEQLIENLLIAREEDDESVAADSDPQGVDTTDVDEVDKDIPHTDDEDVQEEDLDIEDEQEPDEDIEVENQDDEDSEVDERKTEAMAAETIKQVSLEKWEEEYLKRLHRFVDTPRLTKRLVNIYRLLRVTAATTPEDLDNFIDRERGEYAAAMNLLALNIGHPDVASRLFRLLESADNKTKNWSDLLSAIDPDRTATRAKWVDVFLKQFNAQEKELLSEVLHKFRDTKQDIAALRADGAEVSSFPEEMDYYKKWVRHVGRFSFRWHLPNG